MNRLVTTETGGHPLTLNDLGFLQTAWTEIFRGLAVGLDFNATGRGIILTGCALTDNGTTWEISAGYVALHNGALGEVFFVAQHDTGVANTVPQSALYWNVQETDIAPSPVTYKDLTVHNVHKQRRLTLGTTAVDLVLDVLYDSTPTILANTRTMLADNDSWHVMSGFSNSWVNGGVAPKYKVSGLGETIVLSGQLGCNTYTTNTSDAIITLPAGYRPTYNLSFDVVERTGGGIGRLSIATSGVVSVFFDGKSNTPVSFTLDGISFLK